MKLELIADGSPGCPLLLFHHPSRGEAERLLRWITGALGAEASIATLAFVERVGVGDLVLRTGARNRGVRHAGGGLYVWELSPDGWEQVVDLLEPFARELAGWQSLSEEGALRVIFSPSGRW